MSKAIFAFIAVVGTVALSFYGFMAAQPQSTVSSIAIDQTLLKDLWRTWKAAHGRSYSTESEDTQRFETFVSNYQYILEWNAQNNTAVLALNQFADLSNSEFATLYASGNNGKPNIPADKKVRYDVFNLPASVDWRQQGAVTPIKNQGQCGSCWAFSTTGALEGWYFINNQQLVSFSEQQLVDCDSSCSGCSGCYPYVAMQYTAQYGLETEAQYPYEGQTDSCEYSTDQAYITNSDYQQVTSDDPNQLMAALVNQPVSVGVEADQNVWQFYSSGVISQGCGDQIDHAVLAVGYEVYNGVQAFIVKNSWGTSWGVQGYVYLSTDGTQNGGAGVCGILSMPVVPTGS
jgi:C1A family cysteine protease